MYNGMTSPPLTNNPFLTHSGQSAASRFPDISSSNNNDAPWASSGNASSFPLSFYQQSPLQSPSGSSFGGMISPGHGYMSPASPFQMQQGFPFAQQQQQQQQQQPHQLQMQLTSNLPHVSGTSYSYLSNGTHPSSPTSYNPALEQLQSNPNYIAQFDPYSAIGQQGWGGNNTTNSSNPGPIGSSMSSGSTFSGASSPTTSSYSNSSSSPSSFGLGPKGTSHPRDFIRANKSQIEAWNDYAWKQFLNSFEDLKGAWEDRKAELMMRAKDVIAQSQAGMVYGAYFVQQIQQEAARLQHLIKEAESNFDSVTASLFQMQEVFHGYRQSGDTASKARVRQATNAALNGLPTWPLPI